MPQKSLIHEKPNKSLTNYLRAHRRKTGLTQRELAQFLGYGTHGAVSRHERIEAVPSLVVALSYQILYQVPVSEIFAGLTETVELDIEAQLVEFESYLGAQSAVGGRADAIARKLEWLSERRSSGYK